MVSIKKAQDLAKKIVEMALFVKEPELKIGSVTSLDDIGLEVDVLEDTAVVYVGSLCKPTVRVQIVKGCAIVGFYYCKTDEDAEGIVEELEKMAVKVLEMTRG